MNGTSLIKKTQKYLGKNWKTFCKAYGYSYAVPWCCIFVWYIFKICKISKLFYGGLKVCNCRVAWAWCKAHMTHVKMTDAKAGDIVFFTWTGKGYNKGSGAHSIDHIGFIRKKGTSSIAYTVEGNTNGSTPGISKVANRSRGKAFIVGIYRPKYATKKASDVITQGNAKVASYAKKRALEKHKYKNGGSHSWKTTVNCTWFVATCYKEHGYSDVYKRMMTNKYWRHPANKENLGPYLVQHNKKGLNEKKLLPGDILARKAITMPGVWHSVMYIGNGKVAEAVPPHTKIGKLTKRYVYAFRIPVKSTNNNTEKSTKKTTVKTVAHKATYEVIAKNGSNVRSRATKFSSRVGGVAKGKTVKSSKKHGNWIYVPALKGWICTKSGDSVYLKKKQ